MRHDLDLAKGAVVLIAAVVGALYDCTFDAAVGLALAFVIALVVCHLVFILRTIIFFFTSSILHDI